MGPTVTVTVKIGSRMSIDIDNHGIWLIRWWFRIILTLTQILFLSKTKRRLNIKTQYVKYIGHSKILTGWRPIQF